MRVPSEFSPDLEFRVRNALDRYGHCMFSRDEMERLWATSKHRSQNRLRLLEEFAALCGAEVEAGSSLQCARFIPLKNEVPQQSPAEVSIS